MGGGGGGGGRWGGGHQVRWGEEQNRGEDEEWSQCGQPQQWSGSESDIIAHEALRLIMHLKEFISVASVYVYVFMYINSMRNVCIKRRKH